MEDRITVQDIADSGFCAWGIRTWFTANAEKLPPGVSFSSFMKHGMSLDDARSIDDAHWNLILERKGVPRGE